MSIEHAGHRIEVCPSCAGIVSQCRCFDKNKPTVMALEDCAECKARKASRTLPLRNELANQMVASLAMNLTLLPKEAFIDCVLPAEIVAAVKAAIDAFNGAGVRPELMDALRRQLFNDISEGLSELDADNARKAQAKQHGDH